jgi:site-specific recombinase XerD
MQNKVSVLFYIKRSKASSKGEVPIYMRTTVAGRRIDKSTGEFVDEKRWMKNANKVKPTTEEAKRINNYLDVLKAEVLEHRTEFIRQGIPVNYDNLKNKIFGIDERQLSLIDIFEQHNKDFKALVGKEYSEGTLTRYETTLKHTKQFLEWKWKKSDIDIRNIDHEFITAFDFFLRSVRKCANNSAVKYIKNFGKIIRICLDNDWIDKDPFLKFKPKLIEVKRIFLTQEELQAVIDKEFSTSRLNKIRDIFIFSCFTGLAYADAKKLDKSQIVKGIDGENWIYTSRQKTDSQCNIPVLPIAQAILDRYANDPECLNKGTLLPILSNQKMNEYLKEIATLCGISKEFTFHTARHTFATTVTLTNGVPIESVSKMLGHKDIKTTQHYAKILNSKVSNDMQLLKAKLASNIIPLNKTINFS